MENDEFDLVADLAKLINKYDELGAEPKATAKEIAIQISLLLDILLLEDDEETNKLDWVAQVFRKAICNKLGGHNWQFDHCGYWGHKYCDTCQQSQYPELSKLSCGEAITKTNNCTEEEYLSSILK